MGLASGAGLGASSFSVPRVSDPTYLCLDALGIKPHGLLGGIVTCIFETPVGIFIPGRIPR